MTSYLKIKCSSSANQNPVNVFFFYKAFLEKMYKFVNAVHANNWKGCNGNPFTDAVVIGHSSYTIPSQMVTEALTPYNKGMRIHFISNVDGSAITEVLKNANKCGILFIIISENFDDVDVLRNATTAKNWFLRGTRKKWMRNHFVAITSHKPNAKKFGVHGCNIFRYGEYVGDRYTVWSTIGMPVALSIGTKDFTRFLDGARFMDMHFAYTPFDKNAPVILAMIGIWYINFYGYETHAVLPYDQYMQRFPQYVQFLDMKSNGKMFLGRSRNEANFPTGTITWGSAGSNSQHSFFQLLHQGTRIVPCDFIIPALSQNPIENNKHHKILVANFLAQGEALMKGRTKEQVREEMKDRPPQEVELLCQHKTFSGNRPSNSIVVKKITPFTLGALIALYEHKAFVQSVVWDVDPFIHPADDLGKESAERILSGLQDSRKVTIFDPSTNGLLAFIKRKMEPKSWKEYAMLAYEYFTDPPVQEIAKKGELLNLAALAAMLFLWFQYFSNKY